MHACLQNSKEVIWSSWTAVTGSEGYLCALTGICEHPCMCCGLELCPLQQKPVRLVLLLTDISSQSQSKLFKRKFLRLSQYINNYFTTKFDQDVTRIPTNEFIFVFLYLIRCIYKMVMMLFGFMKQNFSTYPTTEFISKF